VSSFSGKNQTEKESNDSVVLPYSVTVKVDNANNPSKKIIQYDSPYLPYFVLAIGNGEVGLNQVKGYGMFQLEGKTAIVGDIDAIVYLMNPNLNLNSQQFAYIVTNGELDILEAYLHSLPTPSEALNAYYGWFDKVRISDEFFDNFNDLFLCLKEGVSFTFSQKKMIARAVVFMRYFFPDLSSQILGSNFAFTPSYSYYKDFLTALNEIDGVCPSMTRGGLLSTITSTVGQTLGTVTSGVSTALSDVTGGLTSTVSGLTSTVSKAVSDLTSGVTGALSSCSCVSSETLASTSASVSSDLTNASTNVSSAETSISSSVSSTLSSITSILPTLVGGILQTPSLITTVLNDIIQTGDYSLLGCALTNFFTALNGLAQQGNLGEMTKLVQAVLGLLKQLPVSLSTTVCNNGTCYNTTVGGVINALTNLLSQLVSTVIAIPIDLVNLVLGLLTGLGTQTSTSLQCPGSNTQTSTSSGGGLVGGLLGDLL
jgi:hypothetical protein